MKRGQAEGVFDEMSARQLAEIIRVIARDRGVQAAAVTIVPEEDRNAIRLVVCAPCASMGETSFGQIVGDRIGAWLARHALEEMTRALTAQAWAAACAFLVGPDGQAMVLDRGRGNLLAAGAAHLTRLPAPADLAAELLR